MITEAGKSPSTKQHVLIANSTSKYNPYYVTETAQQLRYY